MTRPIKKGRKPPPASPDDIELKFDGGVVRRLDGAPADAVIASLNALQRMVLILGMRAEGRALGQRLKPTARVRREFSVVCRAPERGSHVQPFNVASQAGLFTPAACAARERLLASLSAFDSGEEAKLREVLPTAKERWFMAQAAADLLPAEDADLEVTIRVGQRGRFAFKADRARKLIEKVRSGPAPSEEPEHIVGKLQAINYDQTIITLKPGRSRSLRADYPLPIEKWLQSNVRKRMRLTGVPNINSAGEVTGFQSLSEIAELESSLPKIEEFLSSGRRVQAVAPLSLHLVYDLESRLFRVEDERLGIDTYAENIENIEAAVVEELDVLWRQYAEAPDGELAADALQVARGLRERFRVNP